MIELLVMLQFVVLFILLLLAKENHKLYKIVDDNKKHTLNRLSKLEGKKDD